MNEVVDQYGRSFKTLRVSLLSKCNLGCVYCTMGDEEVKGMNKGAANTSLPLEKLLDIINSLHDQLQLETIRLTGGEPLLYPYLKEVVAGVKQMGIPQIRLTTNAFLLERQAEGLRKAGMQSINVSLDALDENVFFSMSRRNGVQKVLNGIRAALDVGLEVKINSVVMKGINDAQILPLLEYAGAQNIRIRFLEVMAMGHLYHQRKKYLITEGEILETISQKYQLTKLERYASATANYWQTDAGHIFGIIANESEPFCHDCNRLRLDSEGNIFGCLSSNHPISLVDVQDKMVLQQKLKRALKQKQAVRFTGSELSMLQIGG
jgi:GTP 3',8-cyclase